MVLLLFFIALLIEFLCGHCGRESLLAHLHRHLTALLGVWVSIMAIATLLSTDMPR